MITRVEFENSFRSLIDNLLLNKRSISLKSDGSAVTNLDVLIEEKLIEFIENEFEGIQIISEESVNSHKSKYDLSKKNFAIIDPIDGTENFYFLNEVYGCVVSIVYYDFEYHGIYIPSIKEIISSLSKPSHKSTSSNMKLLSTSCLKNEVKLDQNGRSNYRVFGSSSYMFYLMLTNKAYSYTYCNKAKIWDCYTGLSLMKIMSDRFYIEILKNDSSTFNPFSPNFDHYVSFHTQLK